MRISDWSSDVCSSDLWYLWKRELQFAVDQAAIAAAWAKSEAPAGTTYVSRGRQEYENNLSLVADFDSGPTITLEDYDGGTDNSVQVRSEEHTSELQSLMRISYAVFCLKKKNK